MVNNNKGQTNIKNLLYSKNLLLILAFRKVISACGVFSFSLSIPYLHSNLPVFQVDVIQDLFHIIIYVMQPDVLAATQEMLFFICNTQATQIEPKGIILCRFYAIISKHLLFDGQWAYNQQAFESQLMGNSNR